MCIEGRYVQTMVMLTEVVVDRDQEKSDRSGRLGNATHLGAGVLCSHSTFEVQTQLQAGPGFFEADPSSSD